MDDQEKLLSRSKSTGFLDKLDNDFDFRCFRARFCGYTGYNPHASVSSVEPCFECGARLEQTKLDSGIGKSSVDGEILYVLEQKIDKLSELLHEQRNLLMTIKDKVISSKTESDRQVSVNNICIEKNTAEELFLTNETTEDAAFRDNVDEGSGASSLLDAIEMKQHTSMSLDHIIRVALENFLQSDDVRTRVAAATAECVPGAVQDVLGGALCAYLPLVQRSHRRLVGHVTKLLDDSFADLEESTASLFKSIHKTSRSLRQSLEKHQNLLAAADPSNNIKVLSTSLKGVLEEELRTWREWVVGELTSRAALDSSGESEPNPPYEWSDYAPTSPMQPANPDTSVIDNLMKCAVIKKHVEDGDVAGAFEEALSSGDLALVMAACRAAGPAGEVTGVLRPAALLALLQQLATDMVHDTQLKCRYLEEAILRLAKNDAGTREHLPLVVREVRQHLTKFLRSYPKHRASRRIALIVLAANTLT